MPAQRLPYTKSALALAREALEAGRRVLPPYAHVFSPKKFTLPQLFAILAIREFFHLDYRATEQLLHEWSDLRAALGLHRVPTYSALCRAHANLSKKTPSFASSITAFVQPNAAG
jgi:hypothetical protein